MPYYAVMIRSDDLLSGAGVHSFDERLIEGTRLLWNDEQWIVEEVDEAHSTPPVVTLTRPPEF